MSQTRILLVGAGDAGMRIAALLLHRGAVGQLTIADVSPERVRAEVEMLACCVEAEVALRQLDGCDHRAVDACIAEAAPDLIVQCASLISPWAIIGRDHPGARALAAAGIAAQAPAQLPILLTVMRAVRERGLAIPVANLSMPDIAHPMLERIGLAPTIGLGNASILHLRARAALRERGEAATLLRVIGHHHHVYGVMTATPPEAPEDAPQLFLGEDGAQDDRLAFEGPAVAPGPSYNVITAAGAVPVIEALTPGAAERRFSAPAPLGLPGGYPARLSPDGVALDLPAHVERDAAIAFNRRIGRFDGVEAIESDGTLSFTESARRRLAEVDPMLGEPVRLDALATRARRLREIVAGFGQSTA